MPSGIYNSRAKKNSVNPGISSDLLRLAKEYRTNFSVTLEQTPAKILTEKKRRKRKETNREAIEAYNQRIETGGVFSDGLKSF